MFIARPQPGALWPECLNFSLSNPVCNHELHDTDVFCIAFFLAAGQLQPPPPIGAVAEKRRDYGDSALKSLARTKRQLNALSP
jgi:hypothetical protein